MTGKTSKPKRINQGDVLRRFGEEVCTFSVGESAQSPGEVQITQYSARVAGPFSAFEARALAAALNAAAEALDGPTAEQVHEGRVRDALAWVAQNARALIATGHTDARHDEKLRAALQFLADVYEGKK